MPKTSRRLTVHPLTLREVEVVRVVDLTPGLRRITLGGEQLREFTSANGFPRPAFDSSGFDDDIRLVFCYPGQAEPVLPVQQERGVDLPRDPRPLSRAYTVRRWDPEASELDVDFVKHGIGDRIVEVAAGDVGGQVLTAGLVDEVCMDVAPVVLGSGMRSFGAVDVQHLLEGPDVVIQGSRVLHLRYPVRR